IMSVTGVNVPGDMNSTVAPSASPTARPRSAPCARSDTMSEVNDFARDPRGDNGSHAHAHSDAHAGGSGRSVPAFEAVDACRQSGELATQLVVLFGSAAEVTQLEPDLTDLARHVVAQLRDLVLEPADSLSEHVHALTQVGDLAAHTGKACAQLAAQLHVLCLLELEVVISAGEAGVHAGPHGFHAGVHARFHGFHAGFHSAVYGFHAGFHGFHAAAHGFHAGFHAGEPCLHRLAQGRDRGASFGVHE